MGGNVGCTELSIANSGRSGVDLVGLFRRGDEVATDGHGGNGQRSERGGRRLYFNIVNILNTVIFGFDSSPCVCSVSPCLKPVLGRVVKHSPETCWGVELAGGGRRMGR